MITAIEARQEQEQRRAILECVRTAAAAAAEADQGAIAEEARELERLVETRAKVAESETALYRDIDPDAPAFAEALAQLELDRARIKALEPRAKIAMAQTRAAAKQLKEATTAVSEAAADLAFAKYRERSAELRTFLATMAQAATDHLEALAKARAEFEAAALLPAIPYERTAQALAPEAIEKSTAGLALAGYLVAVAEQLVGKQSEAEANIGLCEADQSRRAGEARRTAVVVEHFCASVRQHREVTRG